MLLDHLMLTCLRDELYRWRSHAYQRVSEIKQEDADYIVRGAKRTYERLTRAMEPKGEEYGRRGTETQEGRGDHDGPGDV